MSSYWTRQVVQLGLLVVVIAGLMMLTSTVLAHHNTGQSQDIDTGESPTVDDVLDDPQHYVGEVVTLEGEVDDVSNSTAFLMEDDQDLIGEDQILVISVWPDVRVDGELSEGTLVRATGTVRIFNRAELENEYGTLDLGGMSFDDREGEPVLVMGATEFAEDRQRRESELAVVIPPAPTPRMPEPEPEPTIVEPVEPEPVIQEEPEFEQEPERTLPRTATPLPLVALAGLLSLVMGFGIRLFR